MSTLKQSRNLKEIKEKEEEKTASVKRQHVGTSSFILECEVCMDDLCQDKFINLECCFL